MSAVGRESAVPSAGWRVPKNRHLLHAADNAALNRHTLAATVN